MPDGPWPDVIAEALSSVFTLAIGGQRGNYLAIRQITQLVFNWFDT